MPPSKAAFRVGPLRALLLLYKAVIFLAKLPLWAAFYLRRQNRPRTSWSWTKTMTVHFLKATSEVSMRMGRFNGRDPTKEVPPKNCSDARFIWVEAVAPNLVVGQMKEFAEAAGVQSIRIPAYGFGKWEAGSSGQYLAADDEKIVMHLHGGAYVMGTAHPEDITANISRGLLKWGQNAISRTLSVDYRLCSSPPYGPSVSFPSSFVDALAGYVYLVRNLGFKPRNIVIAGDSAGGNLALSLARYLVESPDLGLGIPGGILLFSPWSDPTGTHDEFARGQSAINAEKCDFADAWSTSPYSTGRYGLRSLIGDIPLDEARKNPYITPASLTMEPSTVKGLFTGFPSTYIVSGEGESLIDEIRTLESRMSADMPDGSLKYDEVADAVHDFVALPIWEPERSCTFKRVAVWIQEL